MQQRSSIGTADPLQIARRAVRERGLLPDFSTAALAEVATKCPIRPEADINAAAKARLITRA